MAKINRNNKILFDSDEEEDCTFKTNKSYAKHYDEFRKKELLSHLRNISDEDSSDDDISTDEELINPEFDKEFFNALAYLKNKDPSKYNEIPTFFKNIPTVEETVKSKHQNKSQKPITVADHQREILLKTKGTMSDEEDGSSDSKKVEDLSYLAEQEKLKSDLKKALSSSDDENDDFLQVRSKTKAELEEEENEYEKWKSQQKGSKFVKPLKDFWTSKELSKEDKFLRDYILNKKYLENGDESNFNDIIGISDDEAEIEKQAEYEHKYNFRFEEPDNEFIKRFPRKIEDSVRIEDTKRKDKRKEREERKAKEKELKMKELRELQNIRKREIEEKLLILKDVSGRDDFELKEEDLNSDFDPDQHDKRMSAFFNNEYYGINEGNEKPQFPDIDEELNIEDWDNFDKNKISSQEEGEDDEQHCENDDFIMDCDYDPQKEKKEKLQRELIEMTRGRGKRKRKISKFAQIIKQEKPTFDPTTGKSYAEYLDEYYKLDYEDIIGDQPCRFNYVECIPNDFGLSVEEILMASNKELNQWASLKKTMQNRPKNAEMNDVEKYNRQRNNLELKKKIFKSMFGEVSDDEKEGSENEEKTQTEKEDKEPTAPVTNNKKKKKSKNKKSKHVDGNSNHSVGTSRKVNQTEETQKISNLNQNNNDDKKQTLEGQPKRTPSFHQQAPMLVSNLNNDQTIEADDIIKKTNKKKKKKKNKQLNLCKEIPPVINNNKKRKFDETENDKQNDGKNLKKRKFDKVNINYKNNRNQNLPIGENRLRAFGINPKKFSNKFKYGPQNQDKNNSRQENIKKKSKFNRN